MGVSDALKNYVPEKSTVGERQTYKGFYKVSFFDCAKMEDKGYGESIYAQFKVLEDGVISGDKTNSKFPEFKEYFNISEEKFNNKVKSGKQLLDGFFSVGVDVNRSSIESMVASLTELKGTTLYINAWRGKKQKKKEDGTWEADEDGGNVQKFSFMTEKNALSKAQKTESLPF